MKRSKIFFCVLSLCILTACANKEESSGQGVQIEKSNDNFKIVEEMTNTVGGMYENALLDWSPRFDTIYEWSDEIKLPIDKPEKAEIEVRDNYLYITKSNDTVFDEYINGLKSDGFYLVEYTLEGELSGVYTEKRFLLYKENLIVVFDKLSSNEIMVFVTSGNVSGQRAVTISDMQKYLDEKYKNYIPLEIANTTVSESGYTEFLFISKEQYSLEPKQSSLYVIASGDEILLSVDNAWLQGYPMTVTLLGENLYIVKNELFAGNSCDLVSSISKYTLKNGKFVLDDSVSVSGTDLIIGTVENSQFKSYYVTENAEWDIHNGQKDRYLLGKEYISNDGENTLQDNHLAKDFVGEAGYITENMIYDYSPYFDEVYEWQEGIKMPIPLPQKSTVDWQNTEYPAYSNIKLKNVSSEDLKAVLEPLIQKGFLLYETKQESYSVYKDNFRIDFSYDIYGEDGWYVFAYMGNVVEEREFTRQDAVNLIENGGLLREKDDFEEYYVFAIETQSVRAAGYFEFYVVPINPSEDQADEWLTYYMITDGKDVQLFERGALNHVYPSNANIVETSQGQELIISGMPGAFTSWEIKGYKLENGRFEKQWTYSSYEKNDVDCEKQGIVSVTREGQVDYYLIEAKEGYDSANGRKDYWQIKEKYEVDEQ